MRRALLRWRRCLPSEVVRGVDERDVGERLREVAEQPVRRAGRTPRQQADVVAQRRAAARTAPRPRRGGPAARGCRPARTCRPGTRPRRAAGRRRSRPRRVDSGDEAVVHELALDRLDGAEHPRVVGGQEADERDHQQAGVESLRAVGLHEGVALGVEAAARRPRAWISSRIARQRVDGPVEPEPLDRLDRAVERDPGHHLRVGEVPARAAHLPDALVGLVPGRLEELEQRALRARQASSSTLQLVRRAWYSASMTSP